MMRNQSQIAFVLTVSHLGAEFVMSGARLKLGGARSLVTGNSLIQMLRKRQQSVCALRGRRWSVNSYELSDGAGKCRRCGDGQLLLTFLLIWRGQMVLIRQQVYQIQKLKKSMSTLRHINIEYARTECDSSQENEVEPCCLKTNPLKHKTELCKTYSELGYCNYGDKCRFAHGKQEMVQLPVNQQLRRRKCNGYWGKGVCSYGVRCQFGHRQDKSQQQFVLQVAKGCLVPAAQGGPRLLKLLGYC